MRIEIKIGDLRISAEGQAVRFHCPDLAVSAEQAELIARLLTLLSESLSTPALPQASPVAAEPVRDAQVSGAASQATIAAPSAMPPSAPRFAIRSAVSVPASGPVASAAVTSAAVAEVQQPTPAALPRFAVRSAVSAPVSSPVASASVANDSVPQIDLVGQAPSPRFAVRTGAVATAVVSGSATRVPGRSASATPNAAATTSEAAAAPSSIGPTRRLLGAVPAASTTPNVIEAPEPVEAVAAETAGVAIEAPAAAPQAPVAVRKVIAPKAEAFSEAAGDLTDSGATALATPPSRRVLRPSTPAEGSIEIVEASAPAARAEGESAPRRMLRPLETSGPAEAAPAAPMSSPAASQRVFRPIAASEVTPISAEPAVRRSVRPTAAKDGTVEAVQTETDSADRRPGRPRQTPLNGQVSEAVAATPGDPQPDLQVRRKPGRPLGSRNRVTNETAPAQGPGRPRKSPLASPAAEPAPQFPPAPTATASEPALLESPAVAADSQGDLKGRSMRLVDHLDQWMRENPGPKTREQLLDVAIANSWVVGADAGRIFSMCMNREKNLFTRMPDGNTEIYLRRAELAPPNTPGKLIRRPGTGKPTA